MKLINFDIELDKGDSIYEPGEQISGRVLVNLEEPKTARGLKVRIKGECNVHWTRKSTNRHHNSRSNSQIEHISGSEDYLNLTYYLVGSEHGDSRIYFPAGQQSYPFSFQLPHEIPSSFEYIHGFVKYTVKAVIDRPWKFDHETTKQFNVVSPFDLNTEPKAAQGIYDEDTVTFCCFCCLKVGNMDVRITLPISGYVPGQNIRAKVYFDNRSKVDIEKIKFCLKQNMTFRVPARITTKRAEKDLREEVLKGPFGKSNEITMNILVPQISPSNLDYCNMIDVDYELQIVLVTSGLHCNTRKTYPVFIGTVPLNFVPLHVSTAPALPEAEDPSALYPPKGVYHPMPMNSQPYPQNCNTHNLGFHNDQPIAGMMLPGSPMTEMSSTVPVPGPSTQQIGFVVPPELPPPSYEECITGHCLVDSNQDPNLCANEEQPHVQRYPAHNIPYKID